jgi:membrane-bound inhibitor of C-type lysozyme
MQCELSTLKVKKSPSMRPRNVVSILGISAILLCSLPASAQTIIDYQCRDGTAFIISFYPPNYAAHVDLDGKSITLPKRRSWYGARYVKGELSMRVMKSGILTLKRGGRRSTQCTVK